MEPLKLFFIFTSVECICAVNILIRNFTQCGKPMQYANIECRMVKENNQLCDITYKSPVENGENFRLEFTVYILRGNKWRKLASLKEEKGLCNAFTVYLQDLFYEAIDKLNEPRKCPISDVELTAQILRGNSWRMFVNTKEGKGLCFFLVSMASSLYYQAAEMGGFSKECPIPKGKITVKGMQIDFGKVSLLSLIPKTKLKVSIKSFEKSTGKLGICILTELENV